MPFLIIFIGIPLLEIAVFMTVGDALGLGTTLLLALLTAILGGFILKYQGIYTIQAVQNSINQGKAPLAEIFDGFCLVAAGALLITPGFVTDTIGFLLLLPAFRSFVRQTLSKHTNYKVMPDSPQSNHPSNHPVDRKDVIEGEYERVDDDKNN